MTSEWQRGSYTISTDKQRLDLDVVHSFLTTSYWAEGIPLATVQRSIEHSLAFGLYQGQQQIGFARVVTDQATFAYLADVFVLDAFRGQGLGQWLMATISAHPDLQGLRRWLLATRDAHTLYQKFGFTPLTQPDRFMQRWAPDVYKRDSGPGVETPG
jgi:GNAT superfamily N-acetyltransferase